jgi:chemotaxis methyl-accepting protein methylase
MNKIDLCKTIQLNVSKLTDSENLELFKIILDTNANYTKNNNGIFLNLNWIDEDLLVKINNYITFCIKSQNEISKYELMKTLLNDSINTRDTTDYEDTRNTNVNTNVNTNGVDTITNAMSTVSSVSTASTANGTESSSVANAANAVTSTTTTTAANVVSSDSSSQPVSNANITIPKQKFSSSMKFYLLKKKFMKQNTTYNTCIDNDLTYEDYLIT